MLLLLLLLLLSQSMLGNELNKYNDIINELPQPINNKLRKYFSGVYLPSIKYSQEYYAGAWLAPIERFLSKEMDLRLPNIKNLEGASFCMLRTGSKLIIITFLS